MDFTDIILVFIAAELLIIMIVITVREEDLLLMSIGEWTQKIVVHFAVLAFLTGVVVLGIWVLDRIL